MASPNTGDQVISPNHPHRPSTCTLAAYRELRPTDFFCRQQPQQSRGGAGGAEGCLACLAGACLCCCAEGLYSVLVWSHGG